MNSEIQILEVLLYQKPVGTLTLLPGDKTLFAFNQEYIDNIDRPILSLSFKDKTGGLITEFDPARIRIPPFFSNLLPEGHLRDYLAKRAGVKKVREFSLLRLLGEDLAGAITIRSADGGGYGKEENDDLSPEEQKKRQAKAFRFSLAGVQLKFSAVSESKGGLTIPARGVGGSWIVKLPSMAFSGVPENEFSMMTLARKVQIEVPDVDLVPITSIKGLPEGIDQLSGQALVVRRFDRKDQGNSIHIEDFAQIFNLYPEDKYGKASYRNIAKVLWAEIGEEGIAEFVRRLVFNTLIGNADMHLKNWSLIYRDQRQPSLSPGYDFVSTIAYIPDEDMALKLGKTKKMRDLTVEQLKYFAGKAALPETLVVGTAQETVEVFKTVWEEEKQNLPLQKSVFDKIEDHLPTIPLYSAS